MLSRFVFTHTQEQTPFLITHSKSWVKALNDKYLAPVLHPEMSTLADLLPTASSTICHINLVNTDNDFMY
jgi:hypothetical protein